MLEDKGLGGKGGGCPGLEVNKKEGQFTQTGPPNDQKKSKCLVILTLRRFRGGPVEGFMGRASLETFSGEAQLKKNTLYKLFFS